MLIKKHAQVVRSARVEVDERVVLVTFKEPISHQRAVTEALAAANGKPSELVASIQ